MEIHLVSSLTPDDESRLAPRVMKAIGELLERLPVSYSVRIETSVGTAIHRTHTAFDDPEPTPPSETESVIP